MTQLGKGITIASAILMALCIAPIVLYAAFGPADGNPIGLGLLLVCGTPIFAGGVITGAVLWIAGIGRAADGPPEENHHDG